MTIKIDKRKVLLSQDNYFRTIVSMKPEDKLFLVENNLSLTKIVREAIDSLRIELNKGDLKVKYGKIW